MSRAGMLVPLHAKGKLPATVIPSSRRAKRNTGATGRVRTDAKNAASSNYFGYLVWLGLVKQ